MIARALADCAARAPDRLFATFGTQTLSFGGLHEQAIAFAAHIEQLRLGPGARAAVMMNNSLEAICVIFGLALARVAWVPVNPRLVGHSLAYQLTHSAPHLLVCDEDHLAAVRATGHDRSGEALITHGPGGNLSGILSSGARVEASTQQEAGLFAIMYTSGTTGPPKGALITHRMMGFAGEGVRLASGARAGDVMFLWEPLCHIGGAQMLILPLLEAVHLAMVPRFSASRFWEEVADVRATHIHFLGGILQMLLKQPPHSEDKSHGVRVAWGGGCARETWGQFEERFAIPIRECYGMSEASSLTSANLSGLVGSVGQPMPWLHLEIAAPDEAGRGEILVSEREPGALFSGYFNDPAASEKALQNGVLHSGDLGSLDAQGNLYFHGRINDSIRVKGELVSAWELESVACAHPDIEECAAVGVEATVGEQEIKLFVRLQRGSQLSVETLATWLQSRLAPHQQPAQFEIVDDFPRTPSQRIIKGELKRRST